MVRKFNKVAWSRQWRQNHKEEVREANLRYYKKHRNPLVNTRGYMADSLWVRGLKAREKTYLNRFKVLSHYSNPLGIPICNHCGEQDVDVLCLDHINGGGHKNLREIKRKGTGLYSWLIAHDYPEGYQTLCANCNQRKAKLEQVLIRNQGNRN